MIDALLHNEKLWDLFTKKEEYCPLFLDKYHRFPYYISKHRNPLEPKVSSFFARKGLEIEYPEDKKFAVCLTHDVDIVWFSRPQIVLFAGTALARHQIRTALRMASYTIKKWRLLWNFSDIMKLEEKYGAKSSFYFQAFSENDLGFNYRVDELEQELGKIVDYGWEVGLHGSCDAHNNLDKIIEEKHRLEKVLRRKLIGYRNHLLSFKTPTTWKLASQAGFKYDTTYGYADVIGFRNGMCHPFKPFCLNTGKEIDILEIPLNIQDVTLGERYMKLDVNRALEVIKHLIDVVEKLGGVMTISWHNNRLLSKDFGTLNFDEEFSRQFYEQILKYSHEKNAWITNGEEIWKLWDKMDL